MIDSGDHGHDALLVPPLWDVHNLLDIPSIEGGIQIVELAWRDPRVAAAIVAAFGAIIVALLNPDLLTLLIGWITGQPVCTTDMVWEDYLECMRLRSE